MKPKSVRPFAAIFQVLLLSAASAMAQDLTVTGDLTVDGKADILTGPLSLGTATFTDEEDNQTTAEGLSIRYSELPQSWVGEVYAPGHSTVIQQVANELVNFKWQISTPNGSGGFNAADIMNLSTESLALKPSLVGLGTANTLANQTLSGGAGSILTLALGDGRYLTQSGGTISGNLTVTGSATIGTLATSFSGSGTDNRLPNQVADQASSILTRSLADARYLRPTTSDSLSIGIGELSYAVPWQSGIAIGYRAHANSYAVSIGVHAGYLGAMESGSYSVALGYSAISPMARSVAIGSSAYAAGEDAIVLGTSSASFVSGGIAIGNGVKAKRPGQVVLGSYNVDEPYSTWDGPDQNIFIVGSGKGPVVVDPETTIPAVRSNALVLKRNGNLEIGRFSVEGTIGLLVVGGGTGPLEADRKNALVVSEDGDTSLGGNFIANGAAVLNDSLTVRGEMTTDLGDDNVVRAKAGQVILIPAQGNISMGEFHDGPAPVAPVEP